MSDITVDLKLRLDINEQLSSTELPSLGSRQLVHSGYSSSYTLTSSSSPSITKRVIKELSGNQTLDLTSVADPVLNLIDTTGTKLVAFMVNNLSSNNLTVSPGSTNPYPIGNGNDIVLLPGQRIIHYLSDQGTEVSSTVKNIDFSVSSGSYQVILLFG